MSSLRCSITSPCLSLLLSLCLTGLGACSSPAAEAQRGPSDAGTYDPSDPIGFDPEVIARAGVVLGTCWPDDGVSRNIAELWRGREYGWYGRRVMQAPCVSAAASGCEAIRQCYGLTYAIAPDAGCASVCNAAVLDACGDGVRIRIDCATVGSGCDPSVGCVDGPSAPCTDASSAFCGSDGRPNICSKGIGGTGIVYGSVCSDLGLTCADGSCQGTGPACGQSVGSASEHVDIVGLGCSGDALSACVGGRAQSIDCAAYGPGFSCRTVQGASFCGLGSECVPGELTGASSTPLSCEGNVIVVCSAGRIERIDCTALGFTGCGATQMSGGYGCLPSPSPGDAG